MKFVHFSDTHLGYSDYYKIDPQTGINQREQDFYNAWNQVVTEILQIKPDFVIHAGDLFHTSRPTNRAIAVAMEGIQKITDSGIPFVAISGNHSTPKIRATGSIFESLSLMPNVYAAFQSHYEQFHIGDCLIHCVPHCSLTEELERAFSEIKFSPKTKFNILVSHGAWAGDKSFSMGEFNEQHIPDPEKALKKKFDYIALGHYHKYLEIKPHVLYSGSTERTSFNEAGNPTGFVVVDLEKNETDYREIKTRNMLKLAPIHCEDLTLAEIYAELEKISNDKLGQALVSISLLNLRKETLIQLDIREIDNIFPQVFSLPKTITQLITSTSDKSNTITMGSLPAEFERYIDNADVHELDKNRLRELGVSYLKIDEF
ncbi:MAG: exonuclease SbcCD subunit D [Calditrichaeota bacterium]|nr:exonuclease SbcCD subunit D [Calditrichota bacterium]